MTSPAFRVPQPPTTAPSTRALLATALDKAQSAVLLDSSNSIVQAEKAYREAIRLLAVVLERTESNESRKKLTQIYQTYVSRVQVLEKLLAKTPAASPLPPPPPPPLSSSSRPSPAVVVAAPSSDAAYEPVVRSKTPQPEQFPTSLQPGSTEAGESARPMYGANLSRSDTTTVVSAATVKTIHTAAIRVSHITPNHGAAPAGAGHDPTLAAPRRLVMARSHDDLRGTARTTPSTASNTSATASNPIKSPPMSPATYRDNDINRPDRLRRKKRDTTQPQRPDKPATETDDEALSSSGYSGTRSRKGSMKDGRPLPSLPGQLVVPPPAVPMMRRAESDDEAWNVPSSARLRAPPSPSPPPESLKEPAGVPFRVAPTMSPPPPALPAVPPLPPSADASGKPDDTEASTARSRIDIIQSWGAKKIGRRKYSSSSGGESVNAVVAAALRQRPSVPQVPGHFVAPSGSSPGSEADRSSIDGRVQHLQQRKMSGVAAVFSRSKLSDTNTSVALTDALREDFAKHPFPAPPPTLPDLRPFWLMRCLEYSIRNGGYITARLYIPRCIWELRGVKLAAVDVKMMHCDLVRVAIERLARAVDFKDVASTSRLLRELEPVEEAIHAARVALSKRLPMLTDTESVLLAESFSASGAMLNSATTAVSDTSAGGGSGGGGSGSGGTSTHPVSGGNSAAGGTSPGPVGIGEAPKRKERRVMSFGLSKSVERIQANIAKDKVEDASDYLESLARLFRAARVFEEWHAILAPEALPASTAAAAPVNGAPVAASAPVELPAPMVTSKQGRVITPNAIITHTTLPAWCSPADAEKIRDRIRNIVSFLRGIVCAFAIRDLGLLYATYLKRVREWAVE